MGLGKSYQRRGEFEQAKDAYCRHANLPPESFSQSTMVEDISISLGIVSQLGLTCANYSGANKGVAEAIDLEPLRAKVIEVKEALASICNDYRVEITTSIPNACDAPSRALMMEFGRLQKRKSELLASGEPDKKEYFQKWINPRWKELSEKEQQVCEELVVLVEETRKRGVEQSVLDSELMTVETCFSDQGSL